MSGRGEPQRRKRAGRAVLSMRPLPQPPLRLLLHQPLEVQSLEETSKTRGCRSEWPAAARHIPPHYLVMPVRIL